MSVSIEANRENEESEESELTGDCSIAHLGVCKLVTPRCGVEVDTMSAWCSLV